MGCELQSIDAYPDNVTDSTPAWLAIEQAFPKSSLPALLNNSNSFTVTRSIRIWRQIQIKYNLPDFSAYTPICHNHTFPPSFSDITFVVWKNKDLATLADVYIDRAFATFAQLKEKYALPPSHSFHFLQVRDYTRKNITNFESPPAPSDLYALLSRARDSKRLVSRFDIFTACEPTHTLYLKEAWEGDLCITINDDDWEACLPYP